MAGTLYIVATPIGNLKDITLRSIEILSTVDYIACEDTRRTSLLLRSHLVQGATLAKKAELISFYEQNELQRIPFIINLLKTDNDVALVSDAGTPLVSDPGFKLVREAVELGIRVEPIPGPSAVISALTVSGLPTDKFLFLGFLPKKDGTRLKLLNNVTLIIRLIKVTIVVYESPYRLVKTLEEIKGVFGEIDVALCREMTKIHEEVRREKVSDAISHFQKVSPKGEVTIIF